MRGLSGIIWTLAMILIVFWIIGLVTSNSFGGLLHILLVLVVIAVVVELVRPKRG